jgi:hypothetical protein
VEGSKSKMCRLRGGAEVVVGHSKQFSQVAGSCKVGYKRSSSALIALVDPIHTSIRTARNKRGDTRYFYAHKRDQRKTKTCVKLVAR